MQVTFGYVAVGRNVASPYRTAAVRERTRAARFFAGHHRVFCVLSSALGWAGAAVCVKLILWQALLEIDVALASAAGLLGATVGLLTLRGRASWVKALLLHAMVGVFVGAGVLAHALAARGLVTSAYVRFSLSYGALGGALLGLLLGFSWGHIPQLTRSSVAAANARRRDPSAAAVAWLTLVGAGLAVAGIASGVPQSVAGAWIPLGGAFLGAGFISLRVLSAAGSPVATRGEESGTESEDCAQVPFRARLRNSILLLSGTVTVLGSTLAYRMAMKVEPSRRMLEADLAVLDYLPPRPSHMVAFPAGMVVMGAGSDPEYPGSEWAAEDRLELPRHEVHVEAFELDTTEVTVSAYGECVTAGACTTEGLVATSELGDFCNWGKSSRGNHPINCVSWHQAAAYCRWAGKRLPTEVEWEYAARGGSGSPRHWASAACSCQSGQGPGHTCPVGAFAADDPVADLSGNVWEWTSSKISSYPKHDGVQRSFVMRGGGWTCTGAHRLVSFPWTRAHDSPERRDEELGFRCAR